MSTKLKFNNYAKSTIRELESYSLRSLKLRIVTMAYKERRNSSAKRKKAFRMITILLKSNYLDSLKNIMIKNKKL